MNASLKNFWFPLLICLSFLSCQREQPPVSVEKMSRILTEIHIAESYSQFVPHDSLVKGIRQNQDSLKLYMSAILRENQLSETAFKQSVDWYKSRPDLFDSIYQQVLTNIAILQARENKNK